MYQIYNLAIGNNNNNNNLTILDSERSEECIDFTMMYFFLFFCVQIFDQKESSRSFGEERF